MTLSYTDLSNTFTSVVDSSQSNLESDLAKSFLGLGLKLDGSPGRSRQVLTEIRPAADNQAAFNMARALLTEME